MHHYFTPLMSKRSTEVKGDDVSQTVSFPVVAIGAAAGGFDAVGRLLTRLPEDLGMAYVIILYLSPGEKDVLSTLQQYT